jgi:hypothetical protein
VCRDTFFRGHKLDSLCARKPLSHIPHHESFESLFAAVAANCYVCGAVWRSYSESGYDLLHNKDRFSGLLRRFTVASDARGQLSGSGFQFELTCTKSMFQDPGETGSFILVPFKLMPMDFIGKFSVTRCSVHFILIVIGTL